jgi:intracellular multiplication protein IcmK
VFFCELAVGGGVTLWGLRDRVYSMIRIYWKELSCAALLLAGLPSVVPGGSMLGAAGVAHAQDSLSPPAPPIGGEPAFSAQSALPDTANGVPVRTQGMQITDDNMMPPMGGGQDQSGFRARTEMDIRGEAFNAALNGLLPLKPDEIRQLLEYFDKTRQSVEVPIQPYPEPEVVVKTIALDPGVRPAVIKVGVGHVSTVTFMDLTGSPWSIQDMSWAGNFEIIQPEDGGNVLRITPMSEFAHGNISIRLIDLPTPVTFTLQTARDTIHYRFDARIPEFGPNAQMPLVEGGGLQLSAGDDVIAGVLDGAPPAKAERLVVSGADGRTTAYLLDEKTYVRTPLTLLSPGWDSSVTSADGMNVYALRNAPVLLMSDKGQVVRARLTRKGSDDDE